MFQGTGSDVGKSLVVAGLCRAFHRQGLKVRPFKPQNMSNNAAVTAQGGEIGRAQALQARACGLPPHIDMNPVLLKPQSEVGSQVVVHGKVWGSAQAAEYHALKPRLMPKVLESFERLRADADLVLVEGAGSAAEVNLREGDIANMGFAQAAGVPVVLIGDVDRGGVIASLVGTWSLLTSRERTLTAGYLINRFRGDPGLFDGGIEAIGRRTGWPSFGVVPFFAEASRLPAEDSVAVGRSPDLDAGTGLSIKVAVPILSRIANFDDLDPLIAEPDVSVDFVPAGEPLPGDADLVVLPGSKSTLADLAFVRQQGWDVDLHAHLRRGGRVLGLCGGYQMLGRTVADPEGIEGEAGQRPGLGWLDVGTVLGADKTLTHITARDLATGQLVHGYEMHIGVTSGADCLRPMLRIEDAGTDGVADGGDRAEGAVSADGLVSGCYLHGLFAADDFRHAFLHTLRRRERSATSFETGIELTLDGLADHLEQHLDLEALRSAAGGTGTRMAPDSGLAPSGTVPSSTYEAAASSAMSAAASPPAAR